LIVLSCILKTFECQACLRKQWRVRLISELEKHKAELWHIASAEQLADVLSKYGLVETKAKPIELGRRFSRSTAFPASYK